MTRNLHKTHNSIQARFSFSFIHVNISFIWMLHQGKGRQAMATAAAAAFAWRECGWNRHEALIKCFERLQKAKTKVKQWLWLFQQQITDLDMVWEKSFHSFMPSCGAMWNFRMWHEFLVKFALKGDLEDGSKGR